MLSIRKFVGCAKVVAGGGALLMLTVSPQTAAARSMDGVPDTSPATSTTTNVTQITLSAGCHAALQTLKTAAVNDRQEDSDEAASGDAAGDAAEDAAEVAQFKALWASVRTACADDIAAIKAKIAAARTAPRSAACTSAITAYKSALKALWAAHTRPTDAQLANLRALGQAARTACGWTWTTGFAWRH